MENKRTIFPILREIKGITDREAAVRIETEYGQMLDADECGSITDDYDDWEFRHQRIGLNNEFVFVVHVPDEE